MTKDFSYRLSLVFALILHLVLVLFLLVKFSSRKPNYGFMGSGRVINAVTVRERDLKKKVVPKKNPDPKVVKRKKPKPVIKKKTVDIKKKKIIAAKELAAKKALLQKKKKEEEARKERLKKEMMEKRELEIKEALFNELKAERDQLSKELQEAERIARLGKIDKYKALVMQALDSNWIKPIGINDGDYCKVMIKVAPGGVVLNLDVVSSNGNEALERSAKASVMKSSPLPVPEDKKLFDEFRAIKVTFKEEGVV